MSNPIYKHPKGSSHEGKLCRKCQSTIRYKNTNRCVLCSAVNHRRYMETPSGRIQQRAANVKYSHSEKGKLIKRKSTERHKPIHEARRLQRKYGITKEQISTMLVEQNGECDICHNHLISPRIDHSHRTGKIRGLLCDSCNKALGFLYDDLKVSRNLVAYLDKHQ